MFWIFVQLIFSPPWPANQLYKNPNIPQLETSHYLCSSTLNRQDKFKKKNQLRHSNFVSQLTIVGQDGILVGDAGAV